MKKRAPGKENPWEGEGEGSVFRVYTTKTKTTKFQEKKTHFSTSVDGLWVLDECVNTVLHRIEPENLGYTCGVCLPRWKVHHPPLRIAVVCS